MPRRAVGPLRLHLRATGASARCRRPSRHTSRSQDDRREAVVARRMLERGAAYNRRLSPTRPRVPIALGSGGTLTEEGRAFFQSRLRLFGGWVFLTSGSFFIVVGALTVALGGHFHYGSLFHLGATLIAGSIWLVARRPSLSLAAARMVDSAGTLLMCTGFALMGGGYAMAQVARGVDPLHDLGGACWRAATRCSHGRLRCRAHRREPRG